MTKKAVSLLVLVLFCGISNLHGVNGILIDKSPVSREELRRQDLLQIMSPLSFTGLAAEEGDIQWIQTYGGSDNDVANEVIMTVDGGFVFVGTTEFPETGQDMAWLVKTDANGIVKWQQTYGIAHSINSVIETTDGGFALVGSFGGDYGLIKTDSQGNMQWNHAYGLQQEDRAYSIVQTTDSGFALAGYTESYSPDGQPRSGSGAAEFRNAWLVKTDRFGELMWAQVYGGPLGDEFVRIGDATADEAHSIIMTQDGGFALAGYTRSFGIAGIEDFWLVKTNATGGVEWTETYGDQYSDIAQSIIETSDGGFALIGTTSSLETADDFWLVKTSATGRVEWSQTYGGRGSDQATSIIETIDGGFALTGRFEHVKAWLIKTDATGHALWYQNYGTSCRNSFNSILQTTDGGYVLVGYTQHKLETNCTYMDALLVRIEGDTT